MEEEEELLWSVQELTAVRASGLVGALVGCLPRAPRQNTRLGRPLLLRREERLLLEEEQLHHPHPATGEHLLLSEEQREVSTEKPNHLTELSTDHHREELHPQPEEHLVQAGGPGGPGGPGGASDCGHGAVGLEQRSEEELTETQEQQWEEFLSRSLEEQQQLSLNDRKSALTSSLSGRVSEAELASRLSSLEHSFQFPRSALTVQLSTCRRGLQPIRSQHLPLQPIGSPQQSPEPMGVRLQVFRDLRRRGFYLTSGGKFGVDFLVYPGDPLRFHAHFMALCLPAGGSIPVAELLCCVRLSSNVKKTLLLCSVSPAEGVLYSSLQWSRMS